ncbi:dCTP deaminase [Candidatus Saccharibacteria bacterium]|nr:dCTP deaminase [Candidatus Saccharibacteria bacterium]
MIITGSSIKREVEKGKIHIEPFIESQLNPNSYNFRLGDTITVYTEKILDPKKHNKTKTLPIPKNGIVLQPDTLYLGHTLEVMGSEHYVPIIRGRSSIGRLGIFINITADLIDIGSINQWTLQIHVVQPVRVYPRMLIGQVTFWHVKGMVTLYNGKYQGSRGPVASQIYKDFTDQ